MFWLRQTVNFITWIGGFVFTGQLQHRADEIKIAHILWLNGATIMATTALIGAILLSIIIFKFIPTKQRTTFIVSGLIGGTIGYILWLILLGPIIIP